MEIKRRQTSGNVSIGCWTTNQLDIKGGREGKGTVVLAEKQVVSLERN